MDCDEVEREEIIEKYLTGELSDAQQKDFEIHYFSCPRCLERLQVSRMLQEKLWEKGDKILSQAQKPHRVRVGRRAWAYSAAAVVLVVAAAALWWQLRGPGRPQPRTKETPSSLLLLARIEPPLYIPPALRGVADETTERFRTGMKYYQDGLYNEAIPELQAAAKLNPTRASTRFFLGICLLLTEKTDEGIEELKATVALGESAYLEEAHFYLAKAYLGKGDVGAAKKDLNWIVENSSNLKEKAARILAQLQ